MSLGVSLAAEEGEAAAAAVVCRVSLTAEAAEEVAAEEGAGDLIPQEAPSHQITIQVHLSRHKVRAPAKHHRLLQAHHLRRHHAQPPPFHLVLRLCLSYRLQRSLQLHASQ